MSIYCDKNHIYIYIYDVNLKNNGTDVTNNLFHFQTTNYMLSFQNILH